MTGKSETYEIVSKIAYLTGVRRMENSITPPDLEWYNKLNEIKEARIIRSLCKIRTALMLYYKQIESAMLYNLKNLESLQYFSVDDIKQLREWGLDIVKANYKPNRYIIDINKYILNNIDACRNLFPMWLKWQYIRELFIMPDGSLEDKVKYEWGKYTNNLDSYPYQVYINWNPGNDGNILYNDRKFVRLLYQQHGDIFKDNSKVSDAGSNIKSNIYNFIDASIKTVLIVDCENSDPYKLCSTLRSLNDDELKKVQKVILFDDIHTSKAWSLLERYTHIKVEHVVIERVNKFKSLVDIKLTAGVCREFYENKVDSFIIFSSDSDFWGLISSLPQASFLVMIENEKCGTDIKDALNEGGIFYCSIDDFCTGNIDDLKSVMLRNELQDELNSMFTVNLNDLLDGVFQQCRIQMNDTERRRFIDKYIRTLRLTVAGDSVMRLVVNN
jgi:Protein of unknown function DUF88.